MTNSIPICFYPMRKIVLDDDYAFTQSILLKMHGKNFVSYNSPKEALNYLLQEYQPLFTKSDLIAKNSSLPDSSTQHIVNVDIEKLKQMLSNFSHQDISVLCVDYHMPDMQGIDFLKKIRHLPIKKILITGEKDYRIAIDAFNSGLVDAYLRKDDPDFSNKIQNNVSELEWKYFIELSSLILDIPDFNYLKNTYFVAAFKNFIQENNITAFCLTHIQGSFLTQNMRREQSYVLLSKKAHLQELSKIAEEDGGSQETIEKLKEGKAVLSFGSKDYWEIPANEWDKFLYPATSLLGDPNLVWAVVTEDHSLQLN